MVISRLALAVAVAGLVAPLLAMAPSDTRQPADTKQWQPGEPRLETPWTHEVGPDNALPEYPRPQLVRDDWRSLNGVWQFAGATAGEEPPVGRELDERILVPYPVESALSGVQRQEERMWYRRTFEVPPGWRIGDQQRLLVNFGAVDHDATVWVNGVEVGTHRGGYDAFTLDVTDALTDGAEQEVIVGVVDRTDDGFQPVGKQRNVPDRGIFYTSASGIWQSVWMEPVSSHHVERLAMAPEIEQQRLRLDPVVNSDAAGLTVQATAYDGKRVVGRTTGPAGKELRVPVPEPKLWSPDSPTLYDLEVRLLREGKTVDRVESYFGMREVGKKRGADGKLYLTLNGEIEFNLSTLDQGYWPDGIYTAPTDEALRWDIEQTKRLGFNTIRKHIKVEPARWFYWADRLGVMVWQDMPSTKPGNPPQHAREEFERQLHEIVEENSSWTSITTWVPFNEGWGEWDREQTGRIAEELKDTDPSRMVNAHSGVNCCDSKGDSGRGDMIDHHMYLGPAAVAPDENRVAVDGEHGGFGLEVENHMWFGEGHAYEMTPDKETLTRRYVENQQDMLTYANRCGMSGGVYTQFTDVEHEVNGFYTYDRQVPKMNFDRVRAINREVIRSVDGTGSDVPPPGDGTPGLDGIGFWPLDEGSGSVTQDSVGEADGTLVNDPAWTEGRTGNALRFDGTDQYVDTGANVLDSAGNYSVSAWVRLNATEEFATAVSQDGDSNSAFFLQYSGSDDRFAFSFAGIRALASQPPETGRWYHLVGVRDAVDGTLRLYVDGELSGETPACLGEESSGNLVIGRAKFGGEPVDFFNGAIDQVHAYDRALSADEVDELYQSGN